MSIFVTYKAIFTVFHVLCVVVGMGAAIVTDILFSFFAHNRTISNYEARIIRFLSIVVTVALACIILSGFFIFLSNPEKYLASAKFMTKMSVVGILAINGFLLHRFVFSHITEKGYLISQKLKLRRNVSFALGAISLVSWVTAMSLGVFDRIIVTYPQAMGIYFFVLVCAIIVSQLVARFVASRKK